MIKIPEIKKTIHAFLEKEDGKISKEKLMKTGIILSAVALGSLQGVSAATEDCAQTNPCGQHNAHSNFHCNANCGTATDNQKLHCNTLAVSSNNPIVTGSHNHGYAQHCNHGNHSNHCSCSMCCNW